MTHFERMKRILTAIYPVGQPFRLQDVYPLFADIRQPSQRQTLQKLRNADFLDFLDYDGTYVRL